MVKISKTYTPKMNEKYMCEKHKAYFKKKLLEWRSDIIKTNNETATKMPVMTPCTYNFITISFK